MFVNCHASPLAALRTDHPRLLMNPTLLARLRKSEPFLPGEMPVLIYTLGQLVQVVNKWDGENYETDHSGSA